MKRYVEREAEIFILMDGLNLIELNDYVSNVRPRIPDNVEDLLITDAYVKYPYVYPVLTQEGFKEGKVGIYGDKEKNTISFNDPESEHDKEYYHVRNIKQLPDTINDMVKEMVELQSMFKDDKETELINLNAAVTQYAINDGDDFLKLAIKHVINNKKINVDSYVGKFDQSHTLSNMKQAIIKGPKHNMTLKYFINWCMALGLKCDLTISDNGHDSFRPLKEPVRVTFND